MKLDENYITKYLEHYVENIFIWHTHEMMFTAYQVLRSQRAAEPVQDLWLHQFLHGCQGM